jgi:hypothetical protein
MASSAQAGVRYRMGGATERSRSDHLLFDAEEKLRVALAQLAAARIRVHEAALAVLGAAVACGDVARRDAGWRGR